IIACHAFQSGGHRGRSDSKLLGNAGANGNFFFFEHFPDGLQVVFLGNAGGFTPHNCSRNSKPFTTIRLVPRQFYFAADSAGAILRARNRAANSAKRASISSQVSRYASRRSPYGSVTSQSSVFDS